MQQETGVLQCWCVTKNWCINNQCVKSKVCETYSLPGRIRTYHVRNEAPLGCAMHAARREVPRTGRAQQ